MSINVKREKSVSCHWSEIMNVTEQRLFYLSIFKILIIYDPHINFSIQVYDIITLSPWDMSEDTPEHVPSGGKEKKKSLQNEQPNINGKGLISGLDPSFVKSKVED